MYSLNEKRKILTQCVSEKTPIEIKYTTIAGKTSNKKFLPIFVRGNSAKGKDVGTTNDRVFNLTIEKIEILKLPPGIDLDKTKPEKKEETESTTSNQTSSGTKNKHRFDSKEDEKSWTKPKTNKSNYSSGSNYTAESLREATQNLNNSQQASEDYTEEDAYFERDADVNHNHVSKMLEKLRKELLVLDKRNPLFHSAHRVNNYSYIRVIDELPDVLCNKIKYEEMSFKSLPDVETELEDEKTDQFRIQLNLLKENDEEYLEAIEKLGQEEEHLVEKQKLDRILKDKVRADLGLPKIKRGKEFDIKEHAKLHDYNPQYDLPYQDESDSKEHQDSQIQTLLLPDDLDKRMARILKAFKDKEDQMGINPLKIVFGFLQWYEDDKSEVPMYSPLLILPIGLSKKVLRAKNVYVISADGEEPEINLTISQHLENTFNFKLPEYDEEKSIEDYFAILKDYLEENKPRWKLRRWITMGVYPFATMASVDDLKEEKWPEPHHLTGHDAIAKLTGGKESEESFISTNEPYDIDKLSIETPIPSKVLDADASQYSAVIDVMSEKNSVIQGPPGTGKSQTIANIIAAAVESGKSVLFVAEKIPALQVVANRLKEANLGPLLFELYKGKNIEIIESARTSVEAREEIQQNYNENDFTRVKEEISARIEKIKDYKELIYETEIFDDLKANQLLWKFLDLKDELGMDLDFRIEFDDPPDSFKKIEEDKVLLQQLHQTSYLKSDFEALPSDSRLNSLKVTTSDLSFRNFQDLVNKIDKIKDDFKNFFDSFVKSFNKTFGYQILKEFSSESFEKISKLFSGIQEIDLEEINFYGKENIEIHDLKILKQINSFEKSVESYEAFLEFSKSVKMSLSKVNSFSVDKINKAKEAIEKSGMFSAFSDKVKNANAILSDLNLLTDKNGKVIPKDQKILNFNRLLKFKNDTASVSEQRELRLILGNSFKKEKTKNADLTKVIDETEYIEVLTKSLKKICSNFGISIKDYELKKIIVSKDFEKTFTNLIDKSAEITELVESLIEKIKTFNDSYVIDGFDIWSNSESKKISEPDINALDETINEIKKSIQSSEKFKQSFQIINLLNEIKGSSLDKFLQSYKQRQASFGDKDITKLYEYFVIYYFINKFHTDHGEALSKMDDNYMNRNRNDLKYYDKELQKIVQEKILASGFQRQPPRGNSVGLTKEFTEMALLNAEFRKSKRFKSTRHILKKANNALRALMPVWMVNSLKVSEYLQRKREQFDILIIDEASQLPPERAFPSIVRAKQIVIVGDNKQLPPPQFFRIHYSDSGDEYSDDDYANEAPYESILDMARTRLGNERTLRWHYRSRHHTLIEYSNFKFYNQRLLVFPSPQLKSNHSDIDKGLKIEFLHGNYNQGLNSEEAKVVIDKAISYMKNFKNESLAIVCINKKQADFVHEEFNQLSATNKIVKDFLEQENELEPFNVANLENFQGMERDNIIISTVYGKSEGVGKLAQRFGPVNGINGHRRLNVLFTRAKNRCFVVTSMKPNDIQPKPNNPGVDALRGFLEYAHTNKIEQGEVNKATADSDFEIMVARKLEENGFKAEPQVGVGNFRIDIGVKHPDFPYGYLAGIECDGAMYHSSYSARTNDHIRQTILEGFGWNIYRVWSTDWFTNCESQTDKMISYLNQLLDDNIKKKSSNVVPIKKEIEADQQSSEDSSNPFLKQIGTKRTFTAKDEKEISYFEWSPGQFTVWHPDCVDEEVELIGKISRESLNMNEAPSIYSKSSSKANIVLPKFIAYSPKSNKSKTLNDVYDAIQWIYDEHESN